jgi:tRNA-2-methylthio-N6-dimethylallyladenosine synthase
MTQATLIPDTASEAGAGAQAGGQSKKVFVKTYGCQMNVYDSERMGDALTRDGYQTVDTVEAADLVLINTCHIREKAAEKVYSQLGRLAKLKRQRNAEGGDLMVAVAGCVAQAEGEEIIRRAPVVDVVIGPQTYHRLPEALARARNGESVVETEFPAEDKFDGLPNAPEKAIRARGVTAFSPCRKAATSSAPSASCPIRAAPRSRVPSTRSSRGRTPGRGRRPRDHAAWPERQCLARQGRRRPGMGSGRAAAPPGEIDGLDRIRYTTSHPRDMDDALIAAHRDLPELMPYLHLPVQAGSDRILKAMNRKHTAAEYREPGRRIRAARPDIALVG